MDIRQAILKAADHIEAHPKDFHFMSTRVPHTCGTPGCALGWIGHFAGIPGGSVFKLAASDVLGLTDRHEDGGAYEFYDRMDAMKCGDWQNEAFACARGLRTYADKYHPA